MDTKQGAKAIVQRLKDAGYIAYFAGGWVRDYIMGHASADIDIATNAPPEKILEIFPRTTLVGLAFGVVIVTIDKHHYEVATFRKDLGYTGGRRPEKIELATPQEDALRRDFTINGLFFDPFTETIHNYVDGIADIHAGIIRTIGDPQERFREDRLRMIRAVRFAARFNFPIDEDTRKAIKANAHTLFPAVAMERIWQELNKMVKASRFDTAIVEMHRLGLLSVIFPALDGLTAEEVALHVSTFNHFPRGTPAILYILELFPHTTLDELLELCQYLRTSVHEAKMVEFAHKGRHLFLKDEQQPQAAETVEWANFYAHRFFDTCFHALTARYAEESRALILEKHRERRERLLPHIQRLVDKKPLVTAVMLKDHGIEPGKEMGALLKLAEHLSITHDLHDEEEVIRLLKNNPLWPR